MEPSPQTILIVDDQPDFLAGEQMVLEAAGYHVIAASNVEEGREAARRESVSLAILDVHFPDGNGYDLCREIRTASETADLPVIFLSVRRELKDVLAGIAAGALDFVSKPVSRCQLLAVVGRALAA